MQHSSSSSGQRGGADECSVLLLSFLGFISYNSLLHRKKVVPWELFPWLSKVKDPACVAEHSAHSPVSSATVDGDDNEDNGDDDDVSDDDTFHGNGSSKTMSGVMLTDMAIIMSLAMLEPLLMVISFAMIVVITMGMSLATIEVMTMVLPLLVVVVMT